MCRITFGGRRDKAAFPPYALWVDENWGLTFTFEGEDAMLVDDQDYHQEPI